MLYLLLMLQYYQVIILGLLQGVTELFPISSLGHSVVFPRLFHWNIQQNDPYFLTFLVATHTATALVLFLFFWKDWMKIVKGLIRSIQQREVSENDTYAKLAWLLIVTTIPVGIAGILFEDPAKKLFASPQIAAFVLILNGILLLIAERLRKKPHNEHKQSDANIAKLTWKQSVLTGILQCIALIPGFSRTGSTLTGGLLSGLSHEDAARFSFLLAMPAIGAASVLKLPELATPQESMMIGPTIIGSLSAGIAAYLSVKFLLKYFETKTLKPFGIYCLLFGGLLSLLFLWW